MGFDIQFKSKDGCIYGYIKEIDEWYKICPSDTLPLDVLDQVKEIKKKAEVLKNI
jgi:hypothetical protein